MLRKLYFFNILNKEKSMLRKSMLEPSPTLKLDIVLNVKMYAQCDES